MSRKEKFLFIIAVTLVYVATFGSVIYLDHIEKQMAVMEKIHAPEENVLKKPADVMVSSGVTYKIKRYTETQMDEEKRYFVPLRKEQAEPMKPPVQETYAADTNTQPAPSEELDLMHRCIQAEAGNQSYEGKLAVAEVIRNRVNHPSWPATIEGVILQGGQFGVVANGSINSVTPDADTIAAADAALAGSSILPSDYVYFNTSPNGADPIQIGDHYFSR